MQKKTGIQSIVGFNGVLPGLLKAIQDDDPAVLYAVGGLLVKENLQTGEQIFQKVHNAAITCLSTSPSGSLHSDREVRGHRPEDGIL